MKLFYRFLVIVILTTAFVECARKGRPSGGPKDEQAPIFVTANPPYKSTNFKKKKIKIYFDEYIVLRNLNKKLIVSPPMKNPPSITPQGTPSKYIKISILDTLHPNTTYTFNFGNAVQDNNENNKLESFKYVFSTGNTIDSLKVKGSVVDALDIEPKKNVSLLLYKVDSTYNDSIVYKQKPNYVTNTLDSINYQFTNIKEGKYAVFALNEPVSDYIFNPKTEKIGFLPNTITLPNDSIINTPITLFKEVQPYKFKRGKEVSKGKIQFGYAGKQTNMSVKLLSKVPENFKSYTQFEKNKDTLNYWFSEVKLDSLNFIVENKGVLDTITVRLRKKKIDSLQISSTVNGTLHLKDSIFLITNNPIVNTNKDYFSLIDKDSTKIDFTVKKENVTKVAVLFEKKPKNKYTLKMLPKALEDVYKQTNDSLNYVFNTKDPEDYGTIKLDVENQTIDPIIIQLLENNNVLETKYLTTSKQITFNLLEVKSYTIRAIVDKNNNKIWDTGNVLKKTQPERIIYFDKKIELRANWEFNETLIIK